LPLVVFVNVHVEMLMGREIEIHVMDVNVKEDLFVKLNLRMDLPYKILERMLSLEPVYNTF
jgi:hypothetical protein